MMAGGTRTARSRKNAPAASAARSRDILEFIEQDAEIWGEVERFAQLPDDARSDADCERLHAVLTKAETAWRSCHPPVANIERGDAVRDLVDACDVLLRYGYTVGDIKVIVDVAGGKVKG